MAPACRWSRGRRENWSVDRARGLRWRDTMWFWSGVIRSSAQGARQWILGAVPSASIEIATADLSLMSSTRALGEAILSRHPRLTLLINNAGVFDTKRILTAEKRERVLATNLLSPVLLSQTLLPALRAGAPSRIVSVGSSTSDRARIDPEHLELGNGWSMQRAYAQSKTRVDDGHLCDFASHQGHRHRGQCRASRPGRDGVGEGHGNNRAGMALSGTVCADKRARRGFTTLRRFVA